MFKLLLMGPKIVMSVLPLLGLSLLVSCTTGRWVQDGKTEEDIQQDLKDCEHMISQEEGVELLPEQYTSTRYWEREPPLKSSPESIVARAMSQCMESKGYQIEP